MKRTLLLASIAFVPTFAAAQSLAPANSPIVLAQAQQPAARDADEKRERPNAQRPNQTNRPNQNRAQDNERRPANARQEQQAPAANQNSQIPAAKQDDRQAPATRQTQQAPATNQTDQIPRAKQDDRQAPARRETQQAPAANQKGQIPAAKQDNGQAPAARQERREERQDTRQEKRQENRQENRQETRQENQQERREDRKLDALRAERKETREGDRTVIRERDRTIVREGNRTIIRHDDTERFRRAGANVQVVRRGDRTEQVIVRPGGVRIVTVVDTNGRLVRRSRFVNGREYVLFTNRPVAGFAFIVSLPPPVIHIPRERYIVEFRAAPRPWIYETLVAAPVMPIERAYTLDEVRYNVVVRDRMPRIDIDNITFDTGSWDIRPDQAALLEPIAEAMRRAIEANPNETYMIEGNTDAVGTEDDNLLLSDRRAQAVAEILSAQYQIPPENMIPQGYGESNLKVKTDGPEERNRYVSVRRVTPLLTGQQSTDARGAPEQAPPRSVPKR